MSVRRRTFVGVGAVLGIAVLSGATAWACIAGPTLKVDPAQARPGQEVALSGFSYNGSLPIVVRFNALDGPVLGTFEPVEGRFGDPELLAGKVTIPAGTKPGNYVLIATQSAPDGSLAQVPVRAVVTVTSSGAVPILGEDLLAVDAGRPVGPTVTRGTPGTGALVLVALGAAGLALFLGGAATVAAGRRGNAVPAPVRAPR